MLQNIKIDGINFKEYNGVDKRTGEKYTAQIVGIFDGEKWYSYFDRKGVSRAWNRGDTMEFDVLTKTNPDGKIFYNINLPDPVMALQTKMEKIQQYLKLVDVVLTNAFGKEWKEKEGEMPEEKTENTKAPLDAEKLVEEVTKFSEEKDDAGTRDVGALW